VLPQPPSRMLLAAMVLCKACKTGHVSWLGID
jgi:hypothetical protein